MMTVTSSGAGRKELSAELGGGVFGRIQKVLSPESLIWIDLSLTGLHCKISDFKRNDNMGWRCVIIDSPCKVSVANNYLIVRTEEIRQIHLSEISFLMLACPAINITGVALYELSRNKIKVVFCDEKRNPYGEIVNLYGSHNCAKQLKNNSAGTISSPPMLRRR